MRRPPTIIDVALHAGVSKSTVSNVLQGKGTVAPEIRERVQRTIAKIGYRPNAGARSMRQRSKVLGVVVGDLKNPFHAELAAFIEQFAAEQQHSILLVSTGGFPERESERLRTLIEQRVAAVLFLSSPDSSTLKSLGDDIPRVFVSVTMPGELSISVDERDGTRQAVEHLAGLGHRRIAFVSLMLADEPRIEANRFQGYVDGMMKAGLSISPSLLLREQGGSSSSLQEYESQIIGLLNQRDRPTAVVAALDRIALEIISAADLLSIVIPDDLSLVGFDDVGISGHSRIALTTIAQPMDELAKSAVDLAIGIAHNNCKGAESVVLASRLVKRHTTSSPKSDS
ncbi:LacI family DNA-binding transcriptional regulator [Sinorhizobium meliloti]|uniref:LacI family DNA-binding transcriptional regulator n=1 Tax=Rhizobium meliloti TaxID=382 RepID=UPI000FD55A0C|nr:LacI family DNA-binding transcriptional regulator [Sinorhizobium meliloti]MQV24942.1 LacI family DNA-binding transcriptional regulator [Sinorhizobium meliloti]MQV37388.1 LacI family DNA-binding transcriptional regulator [Sinorhizobium meliloti]RVE77413.1 LacI family transcriptional regulator [Sinorhizobium meliloti]RVG41310.1 LacI family transcriptional regulator [Sinorhizobium meliloti]RVM08218.1 LacI family transcriptional regulator [Sinorhizobium meliloti]